MARFTDTVTEIAEAALLIGLVWFLYEDVIVPIRQAEQAAGKALSNPVFAALAGAGAKALYDAIQAKRNEQNQPPSTPPTGAVPAAAPSAQSFWQTLLNKARNGIRWTGQEINQLVKYIMSGQLPLQTVLAGLAALGISLTTLESLALAAA